MDTPAFFREARQLNSQLEHAFRDLEPYAGSNWHAAQTREALRQQGLQLRYALGTEKPADLPDPFRVNEVCIQARQLAYELSGQVQMSTAPAPQLVDDLPSAPERESLSLRELWERWAEPRRNRQPINFGSAVPLAQAA